jgi:hypothetical protein
MEKGNVMPTTVIKNTQIKELMEISSGNLRVLEKMTEEFRRLVQEPLKSTEQTRRNLQFVLRSPVEACTVSVSAEPYGRGHRIIITIE